MDRQKQRMISVEEVSRLREALSRVPAYEPTHVSKQQAINMVSEHLHAMHAVGYRWKDVAEKVTEWGVAVTAEALRTYLRRVPQALADTKAQRPGKESRGRLGEPSASVAPAIPAQLVSTKH